MDKYLMLASVQGRYFHFDILKDRLHKIEDIILFAIICFLVYIWIKLFLYWDNK